MKNVILSLFVLASIASSHAAEQAEPPVGDSEGGSKPLSAIGASTTDLPPVSVEKVGGDSVAKAETKVEGVGEKPAGDDAASKKKDVGKKGKAKDSKDGKCGCVVQ